MSDTAPYLQRNPGPDPVDVPAIPATVGAGESVAWHIPIAGFELVPDDAPAPSPEAATDPAPDVPAKTTTRARTAVAGEE
ncbi:hypothetical protein F7Q99_20190 [Streptomyces kaniharaensis]|uniref:Uncharacterized protein n=1 Tax=Streptomyces kaniharaensis TaxID=212423 RepID=A0A6N7KSV9_9ACTN|nr:hypothetical protein [Streptomyces kaniharaensis]MQS14521.1 hypothetical protein [Streptomyces kaniharaensis]